MNEPKKKSNGLWRQFISMMLVFLLLCVSLSAVSTYVLQNRLYNRNFEQNLINVNAYLKTLLEEEVDFAELVQYYKDRGGDLGIPWPAPTPEEQELAFERAFRARYGELVFGRDMGFADLDEKTKLDYARWRILYWTKTLNTTMTAFGLDYCYFTYPTGENNEMVYMLDCIQEPDEREDGTYLLTGISAEEDPTLHAHMWEAWDTAANPTAFDVLNNEFGHVYSYSTPILVDGEIQGLVTSEISVGYVAGIVRTAVLRLCLLTALVLVICTALMLNFVRRFVLKRIARLEELVQHYGDTKDDSVADTLRNIGGGIGAKDEINSLADGFAEMILRLREHMRELEKVTAERERISAELNVATNIQASMLPRIFPPFPEREEFELYASMDPAKEVGGDFYDFFLIDDSHLAMVIADVSGKGVPASLFMAISKVLIKDNTQDKMDPAQVLFQVNNQLCEDNDEDLFVTVWLGILDLRTGEISFVDAGHEYPVLLHTDGTIDLVKAKRKRPPVATIEGIRYQNNTVQMRPGDTIFLYTDGVPEATNSANELFGMERTEAVLRGSCNLLPRELLKQVRANVDAFVGDAPQFDDLTMLALRLNHLSGEDN